MAESVDPYPRRRERLRRELERLGDPVVAFSGGVDSTVLLHAALAVPGSRAVALVADSPSLPRTELAEARRTATELGARLVVLATGELDDPRYAANLGDRCYHCKHTLFRAMAAWARAHGHTHLAFGEIADDALDDRPGSRAAVELGVVAPLARAGFTKTDVRRYAREAGLAAAERPASACLASRLPVGTRVTRERLARIEEAEARVRALGFRVLRVRDRGPLAGLEIGADELGRAREHFGSLEAALRDAGFEQVELAPYVPPAERVSAERSAAAPRAGPARDS